MSLLVYHVQIAHLHFYPRNNWISKLDGWDILASDRVGKMFVNMYMYISAVKVAELVTI